MEKILYKHKNFVITERIRDYLLYACFGGDTELTARVLFRAINRANINYVSWILSSIRTKRGYHLLSCKEEYMPKRFINFYERIFPVNTADGNSISNDNQYNNIEEEKENYNIDDCPF